MQGRNVRGIVIDAAHGGEDTGVIYGDLSEKELTLQVSQYIYDRFN